MNTRRLTLALGLVAALALAPLASYAAGMWPDFPQVGAAASCASTNQAGVPGTATQCTNTIPAGPSVVTGNETVPADTNLSQGQAPQTVRLSMASLNALPPQYAAPLTGASVTVLPTSGSLIIDPAGTIAALTVVLPAATTLIDGQQFEIASSNTVTALTLTPGTGTTVANTPTAITISTTATYGYKFVYRAANTKWYRLN